MTTTTRTRRRPATPAPEPKVYDARNRRTFQTRGIAGDMLRTALERRIATLLEKADADLARFQARAQTDAYDALDWQGKDMKQAAADQRVARMLQADLAGFDERNDGYASIDNFTMVQRVMDRLTTDILTGTVHGRDGMEAAQLKAKAKVAYDMTFDVRYAEMTS